MFANVLFSVLNDLNVLLFKVQEQSQIVSEIIFYFSLKLV